MIVQFQPKRDSERRTRRTSFKVLRQLTAVLRQVFYSDQDFLSRWHAEGNEPFAGPLAKIRAALAELFAAASAEMGDSTRWPASRGL